MPCCSSTISVFFRCVLSSMTRGSFLTQPPALESGGTGAGAGAGVVAGAPSNPSSAPASASPTSQRSSCSQAFHERVILPLKSGSDLSVTTRKQFSSWHLHPRALRPSARITRPHSPHSWSAAPGLWCSKRVRVPGLQLNSSPLASERERVFGDGAEVGVERERELP